MQDMYIDINMNNNENILATTAVWRHNDIAWLHGFDTLIYEYTQQGELIIVLMEQKWHGTSGICYQGGLECLL